jgi:hypothetical protein
MTELVSSAERRYYSSAAEALQALRDMPFSQHVRDDSSKFEQSLKKSPNLFLNREKDLQAAAEDTLEKLRSADQKEKANYFAFASDDILRGLNVINHPKIQLIIVERISPDKSDKDGYIPKIAIQELSKAETIYPETIACLWKQEATRGKLFSLIEINENCGIKDKEVIPEIENIFLQMLDEKMDPLMHPKAIKMISLLYGRSGGKISENFRENIISLLLPRIRNAFETLKEDSIVFPKFLEETIAKNRETAEKSTDIAKMEISIPERITISDIKVDIPISEIGEMVTLYDKLVPSSLDTTKKYHSLLALAKTGARSSLEIEVVEKIRKYKEAEAGLESKKAFEKQQEIAKKQKEKDMKIKAAERNLANEKSLADEGLKLFPHLKKLFAHHHHKST